MGALLGRDDGRITDERVVDARVRHQVGLKLVQVDIESSIKTQTRGDRADNLSNQTVEMLVVGTRNVQVATADVVDSFVVNEERAVGVLDSAMSREDSIVGLNYGGGDARSGIHGKFKLALLAVIGGQALEQQSAETRTRTATKGVEDEETLKGRAVVYPKLVARSMN